LKTLQIDKAVDKHLKPVKDSDGTSTALEISTDDVSVKSSLKVEDDLTVGGAINTGDTIKTPLRDMNIIVGGDTLLQLNENGDDGNHVLFRAGCAGFTRKEATFSNTSTIGSGGTDDTDIDFRHSNKYHLEMTGDITNMNLIFPSVAGNFLLVCRTNGDHDVTNWKVYEYDESAASTTDVMWAGGSVPTFTDTGIDIVSFYWDNTLQRAYGTVSLAFDTP
jgi:hypothetical protein